MREMGEMRERERERERDGNWGRKQEREGVRVEDGEREEEGCWVRERDVQRDIGSGWFQTGLSTTGCSWRVSGGDVEWPPSSPPPGRKPLVTLSLARMKIGLFLLLSPTSLFVPVIITGQSKGHCGWLVLRKAPA